MHFGQIHPGTLLGIIIMLLLILFYENRSAPKKNKQMNAYHEFKRQTDILATRTFDGRKKVK